MSGLEISESARSEMPLVVIAGASGFVGRALAGPLSERFQVVGMSRSAGPTGLPWIRWFVYVFTQASRHALGMAAFCRHVARRNRGAEENGVQLRTAAH